MRDLEKLAFVQTLVTHINASNPDSNPISTLATAVLAGAAMAESLHILPAQWPDIRQEILGGCTDPDRQFVEALIPVVDSILVPDDVDEPEQTVLVVFDEIPERTRFFKTSDPDLIEDLKRCHGSLVNHVACLEEVADLICGIFYSGKDGNIVDARLDQIDAAAPMSGPWDMVITTGTILQIDATQILHI